MSSPLFQKKGSSVWWCRVPNPHGGRHHRISTGHRDRTAALAEWRRLCRESIGGADRTKDCPALHVAIDAFLDERERAGKAAGTISSYEKKGRHINRVLGMLTPLNSITAVEVDHYIATRLKEEASRSTIAKELVVLRGTLKHARRRKEYAHPVDEVMPVEFSPQYRPRERALSEREIDALLRYLPAKRAAVVAFVIATATTYPSEVEGVSRKDVDLVRGFVRIRGTKRESRDREVPIVDFARAWIEQALPYVPFERWTNIRRDLHQACDELGIARCSPTDLRRTMRARGAEPQLLGAFAGHADSRMVEKVYARLSPEQLAKLLRERLGGQPGARGVITEPSQKRAKCS
jgi:integrase